MQSNDNRRLFFGIDFLRFCLSCIILIAHFPHFSAKFVSLIDLNRNKLPLYDVLNIIYDYGGVAVQIFWMISGLVFYNFYNNSISSKKIRFTKFILLRLSKLYPVHIITLFLVTILQLIYFSYAKNYLVYQNFDLTHFFLNLFMVSYWNAKYGLSFNGPFWSVSVEIFVYILFYYFSFSKYLNSLKVIKQLILVFFLFYILAVASPFHECLLFFFVGIYIVKFNFFSNLKYVLFSFLLFLFSYFIFKLNYCYFDFTNLNRVVEVIFKLALAQFSILFFSFVFKKVGLVTQKVFRLLSSITYSVYMFHFTVQLILVLLFREQTFYFFNSISFLILYITLSISFGVIGYFTIEAPIQTYLRKRFLKNF